jgi:Frag1/DRAM/Sfk1 family
MFLINPISLVILLLVTSSLTISSSMLIAFKQSSINSDFFFISVSFYKDPCRAIASFGLPIMAILAGLLLICQHLHLESLPISTDRFRSSQRIQTSALYSGLVACLGLIGTGAVSITTHLILHLGLAGIFFIGLLLSMLFHSLVKHEEDEAIIDGSKRVVRFARWLLLFIGITAATLLILNMKKNPKLASSAELVVVTTQILYVSSFLSDLKNCKLQISIVKEIT